MANAKLEPGKPDATLGKQKPVQQDQSPPTYKKVGLRSTTRLPSWG